MGSNGEWKFDSRSSKEYKRDWIDGKTTSLMKSGHTKQFARTRAKQLYREQSR